MAAAIKIGTIFAGYRIEGVLGRGGMGVVYLAEQAELGRKVAIKVIAPALASDSDYLERFKRESRLAAAIEHPNAIPIQEAGVAQAHVPYLVMRYVEGEDHSSLLRREGPHPPRPSRDHLDHDRPFPRAVVEVDEHQLLPGSECETAVLHRHDLRGADDRSALVRVRVRVVVEAVVLVVAVRWDQPVEQGTQVVDPARLEFHGGDRRRRSADEGGSLPVGSPGVGDRRLHAAGDVDDVRMAAG